MVGRQEDQRRREDENEGTGQHVVSARSAVQTKEYNTYASKKHRLGYGVTANIAASQVNTRQLGVRFPVFELSLNFF